VVSSHHISYCNSLAITTTLRERKVRMNNSHGM
jgi:hypothetical protein